MVPCIQNIMCTVDLGCLLDLPYIAQNGINLEYKPEKYNPIIMRIRKPKSTALIFTSGKLVCTGTKDEEAARIATRRFARIIQKLGFPVHFLNFRITNFVGSSALNFQPDLHNLVLRSNGKPDFVLANDGFYYKKPKKQKFTIEYTPELFPALVYREGVTILLFKSGKFILTNAKTRQQLYDACDKFVKSIHRPNEECSSSISNGST